LRQQILVDTALAKQMSLGADGKNVVNIWWHAVLWRGKQNKCRIEMQESWDKKSRSSIHKPDKRINGLFQTNRAHWKVFDRICTKALRNRAWRKQVIVKKIVTHFVQYKQNPWSKTTIFPKVP
jgi:hypothetical protein